MTAFSMLKVSLSISSSRILMYFALATSPGMRIFRALLEIAEKENSMRKLLREIDRTKRRSNAIENILIPGLVANAKYIRMRLDEMERETFSMLKAVKRNLEAKNAADGGAF